MKKTVVEYDVGPIIAERKRRGWGQSELAFRMKISQTQINRIEKGRSQKPKTMKKLARKLGLKLPDLVVIREVTVVPDEAGKEKSNGRH